MSITKVTGNTAIDKVLSQLSKQFGKDLISTAPSIKIVPAVPTGSLGLDCALGIGGLPQGRIVEVYGDEASSKTSLCLEIAAQCQKLFPKKYVYVVDMEYTMTGAFIEGFGIDMNRLLFGQCDSAEEALQSTMDIVKSGEICAVVFDSIDACQRESMLNKGIGENDVGGISRIASRFFREYSKVSSKANCLSMFINQIRLSPTPYGNQLSRNYSR